MLKGIFMTLDEAKKYLGMRVNLLGAVHVIKEITQCSTKPDLLVAHLDNKALCNLSILKNPETGKFLGEETEEGQ
jgi:hypothetical protein